MPGAEVDAQADADERRWLALAAAGDAAAFERLVRLHQGRVRLQLRRLARNDLALADDLAQETFVQAWQHLAEFRGDARFATWLYRIAYRRFLMHRRAVGDVADADAAPKADDADVRLAHDPRAAHTLRLDMAAALARLPEAERTALVHCYHLDLTHDEAAAVLGVPLGTLKSQVARAKTRLADWLAAWAPATTTEIPR